MFAIKGFDQILGYRLKAQTQACHHPGLVESVSCLAVTYFIVGPLPHMTSQAFTPCQPGANPLSSCAQPSTACWQAGQGRWPNLSVKASLPRGSTTDTNYHTAGARPGNRMATTWSNQGTQQQGKG